MLGVYLLGPHQWARRKWRERTAAAYANADNDTKNSFRKQARKRVRARLNAEAHAERRRRLRRLGPAAFAHEEELRALRVPERRMLHCQTDWLIVQAAQRPSQCIHRAKTPRKYTASADE